jgi:hypothetical protein
MFDESNYKSAHDNFTLSIQRNGNSKLKLDLYSCEHVDLDSILHSSSNTYGPVGKKLNLMPDHLRNYLEAPPSIIDGD